jgi:hypothetical protein
MGLYTTLCAICQLALAAHELDKSGAMQENRYKQQDFA